MKSVSQRIQEFVDYHINGDGECNTVVLVKWASKHGLSEQQKYELAYFFAITYSVVSAIALYESRDEALGDPQDYVTRCKNTLVFQSDRKYVRMKDSFLKCLQDFRKYNDVTEFDEKTVINGVLDLRKAIPIVEKWTMFGRFSAFLFLEMLANLRGMAVQNTTIDWKDGSTATSGLLNLLGYDSGADLFDRTKQLIVERGKMDNYLQSIVDIVRESGGSTSVTELETSLCAYRKFYKGSRYNGYYLDRMLEEIYKMQDDYPHIAKEVLKIRRESFREKYLGELGGWKGIRAELKKYYKETGLIT